MSEQCFEGIGFADEPTGHARQRLGFGARPERVGGPANDELTSWPTMIATAKKTITATTFDVSVIVNV